MENKIFRICISFYRKKKPLTRKLFYISIFTSNHFRTELQTRNVRERERERERKSKTDPQKHQRVAPSTSEIAPIVTAGSSSAPPSRSSPPKTDLPKTDLVLDPPKTELVCRAMPKAPASSSPPSFLVQTQPETQKPRNPENPFLKPTTTNPPLRRTHSSKPFLKPPTGRCQSLSLSLKVPLSRFFAFLIFFVLIFVSLIVYIFWFSVIIYVWILRKYEKHDKNGFSRAFSGTQPNTRKYFPKHFLKCNQTLEKIFLSRKYFHLKLFYTRKLFYTETNTALGAICTLC